MKHTYDPREIESKWSQRWVSEGTFTALDTAGVPKSYVLIEFPYPSGERLHVGHARSYSCMDALCRKRRMQGINVMFPFGWDAFGLPAENYAIKTGVHPSITTTKNIANAKAQAISWGLSFDWSREVNTTDPNYYKWTQWIFLQLFKSGLAYKAEIAVNWCPSCKINLANEEVIAGNCERCGNITERRMQKQWMLRITAYAERLLQDLSTVNFRKDIAEQQINWIGKKSGINIDYQIEGTAEKVVVFTTTPVNFAATFLVLAPEHKLVRRIIDGDLKELISSEINQEVAGYVQAVKSKSERDRLVENREKTGVFTGLYVKNHLTGDKMPVWISDFVLSGFGTGAIQGCPAHDKRDFEFASKFGLPIKKVVVDESGDASQVNSVEKVIESGTKGTMINSQFLDGMEFALAMEATKDLFEKNGWGTRVNNYHLRDWVFSRQHYWGEPIPMVFCQHCYEKGDSWFATKEGAEYADRVQSGYLKEIKIKHLDELKEQMKGWFVVSESQLPVRLPEVEKYQPTDTGQSPLANIEDWCKVKCPNCGGEARRETDTMPNWAGSSWYFLRYCDSQNNSEIASMDKLKYWLMVDWYNGGMEHTTLHLLYSRFWHKFLFDLGVVPTSEPYARRTSHGVILGPDGKRMSKSRGNVINPDQVIEKYGADALRMYEMFIGPFEQMVVWDDRALSGVYRFVNRVWDLAMDVLESGREQSNPSLKVAIAKLAAKVDRDLEEMKFNTAISGLMEFINLVNKQKGEGILVGKDVLVDFVKVIAPMAPFVAEEIWQLLGVSSHDGKWSVHHQPWPNTEVREEQEMVTVVLQVNGKVRGKMLSPKGLNQEDLMQRLASDPKLAVYVADKSQRVVWVPDRLVNLVKESEEK